MSNLDYCKDCRALLLDTEMEHCLGGDICFDCCEELHLNEDEVCQNVGCPYKKCNAHKRNE